MIVKCQKCYKWYDDTYRLTYCPHEAFAANDGNNNFKVHEDSYLSNNKPTLNDLEKVKSLDDIWAELMLPSGNVETEVDALLQMEAEEEKELNKEPS